MKSTAKPKQYNLPNREIGINLNRIGAITQITNYLIVIAIVLLMYFTFNTGSFNIALIITGPFFILLPALIFIHNNYKRLFLQLADYNNRNI